MSNIGTRLSNIENKLSKVPCPNVEGHYFGVHEKDGIEYEDPDYTIIWDKSKECDCGQPSLKVIVSLLDLSEKDSYAAKPV